MSENKKKKIMEMVYQGKLSAEEGARLYKELLSNVGSSKLSRTADIPSHAGYGKETGLSDGGIIFSGEMDIAIIGISGQFPEARNVEEFWNNLVGGVNAVKDISARWDIKDVYNPDRNVPNKTYCKWGGLLSGIDEFDPMFFELSPRQAELMEPRQRLFLMECWKALEDAGYSGKSLEGKKCGVFVGCEGSSEYFDDMKSEYMNAHVFLGHSNSILASRISYFMDLQGPSVTIDTACSSSLVAVHLACESIRSGNCELAIAGGVQILADVGAYVLLCSMGMLSPEGKCKAFDDSADGFVPGEAVGSVILKPLKRALEDGDHIYAVIKGSGINQDGKTNGITAPSALSQARLEQEVYNRSGIRPDSLSYIETHGTGTMLGDPIEFEALKNTFREFTDKKQFCALGSVKTNIGHASAASGIASLIKTLLAMKYSKIPPSLHYTKSNRQINFEESPFFVAADLMDWKVAEGQAKRAAVSSFGHSGTNCHIVLEEYNQKNFVGNDSTPYFLVPLSAKSKNALKQKVRDLYSWIEKEGFSQSLKNTAYTLMVGRSHFNYRCCLIASNMDELKSKLKEIYETGTSENYLENLQPLKVVKNQKEMLNKGKSLLNQLSADDFKTLEDYYIKLFELAELYIKGYDADWQEFHGKKGCTRISLPVYPFAREKYWIPDGEKKKANEGAISSLAPLVDSNESTLEVECFKKVFTGEEFFLQDHMNMLPAVVYIEMARSAGNLASTESEVVRLRNLVWASPITVPQGSNKPVYISFYPKTSEIVDFEVTTEENGQIMLNSQGSLVYGKIGLNAETVDVRQVMERCTGGKNASDVFYKRIKSLNVVLGPRFMGMQEIYYNNSEALSIVGLPPELESSMKDYIIHPTLTDGAFQTAITWAYNTIARTNSIFLPFVLGELEIVDPSLKVRYAYVTKAPGYNTEDCQEIKYNIKMLDSEGRVALNLKEFSVRAFQPEVFAASMAGKKADSILYYGPEWMESPANISLEQTGKIENLVIFDKNDLLYNALKGSDKLKETKITLVKQGLNFNKSDNNEYTVNPSKIDDYERLLDELNNGETDSFNFIHAWCEGQDGDIDGDIEEKLNKGIYSLFYLTKALMLKASKSKTRLLYLYNHDPLYAAVSGFVKTLSIENPNYIYRTVQIKGGSGSKPVAPGKELADNLIEEFGCTNGSEAEVRYDGGRRFVKQLKEIVIDKELESLPLKEKGLYLITGGTGGLGLLFAEHLCNTYKARVVLIGRSDLTQEKEKKINELNQSGGEAIYIKSDIVVKKNFEKLVKEVRGKYGSINGVLHTAGVVKDSLIVNKTIDQMKQVFEPKIHGLINIAEALKDEGVDFIALFSSTSAVMGNLGQIDYAFANSFMDNYASVLNENGKYGKAVSINWPLWAAGGMKVDDQTGKLLLNTYGMSALTETNGLNAFKTSLILDCGQVIVIGGNAQKIRRMLSQKSKPQESTDQVGQKTLSDGDGGELFKYFKEDMLDIICGLLRLSKQDINIDDNMEEFGFDSITFTELANKINEKYDFGITPAVFFSHASPSSIVSSLFEDYMDIVVSYYGDKIKSTNTSTVPVSNDKTEPEEMESGRKKSQRLKIPVHYEKDIEAKGIKSFEPIAVIGIAGIMPQSEDVNEFWDNIEQNRDLMSEIPKDRWDWEEIYGDPQTEEGKTNIKWGAFMKEIDKFDPMFFSISGADAEIMDPQERLILQTAWKAIEDAGYKASHFSGTNMGVFIGVSTADYKELLIQSGIPTILSQVFIANRISYTLNLKGPSEPVDTACSSSLVAVHKAVEAIHNGSCDTAIAGGINIITCPNLYITQSKTNMLSVDGRCKTFDESANGYARGEGVGVVILKPLKKAEADGDHIYAVIKGSAINHGGHGSNLLAPNSKAQAEVIISAYEKANIDPATVSFIETHGTGTSLGDPIEIDGLKIAFKELYKKWGKPLPTKARIGLGALKTNIGHLEAASGIAGLLKVILALKNKKLIALQHFKQLNPYIKLDDSPFKIITQNAEWEAIKDDDSNPLPRRAGLSSFGVGGVNAHLVIEEYCSDSPPPEEEYGKKHLIILSAKDGERLKDYTQKLYQFIMDKGQRKVIVETAQSVPDAESGLKENLIDMVSDILNVDRFNIDLMEDMKDYGFEQQKFAELAARINEAYNVEINTTVFSQYPSIKEIISFLSGRCKNEFAEGNSNILKPDTVYKNADICTLEAMAFTFQLGREEMEERLAVIVSNMEELAQKLKQFYEGKSNIENLYQGNIYKDKGKYGMFTSGKAGQQFIQNLVQDRELERIAQLWVSGVKFEWNLMYPEHIPQRVSLTTYPFAKERFWIPVKKQNTTGARKKGKNEDNGQAIESNAARKTKIPKKSKEDEELMDLLKKLEGGRIKTQDIE